MKPPFTDVEKLGFGKIFTPHMFMMKHNKNKGWYDAGITEYGPLAMAPASCVLHYAQEIFEGQKAYLAEDGRILMFRPWENIRRMNNSAQRLCLPVIEEKVFLQALTDLIMLDKDWIPTAPGTSLYVRPTMIGVEPVLGVHPASEVLFFIILSPSGPYYKAGFEPISIYVEDQLVRAIAGGVGDVKTGGNYAASLLAGVKAQEKGFAQVLWLDGKEHKYVEEVGSMNVAFVMKDKLLTPPLNGSILPGITRASVLEMARDMGHQVVEAPISIDEVLSGIQDGTITEVFGTGTAAVISPVGLLHYKGQDYVVNNGQVGSITKEIYEKLVDIQLGKAKDEYGWVCELGRI